jgi:hypothetical protein
LTILVEIAIHDVGLPDGRRCAQTGIARGPALQ